MRRVLLLASLAACAGSASTVCEDGRVCPADTECYTSPGGTPLCLTSEQKTACEDKADGLDCTFGTEAGLCHTNICLAAECGDGFRRGDEQCDGNELGSASDCQQLGFYESSPLTCNSACSYNTDSCKGACGDGMVQPPYEICDGAPPAISCSDLGYGAGFLDCNNCGPDVADCHLFGWDPATITLETIHDLHGSSDQRVFAVGDSGTLMRYDGGYWTPVDLSGCGIDLATYNALSVWTFDDSVFVGGSNGTVLRVTSSACTVFSGVGSTAPITDLWALSATDVYAVSSAGVYHFDGAAWSTSSSTTGLARLWGSSADDVYAVGNADPTTPSATIIHKNASGWSSVSLVGFESIATVWGSGANDVYVGGWSAPPATGDPTVGLLVHFNGSTWSPVAVPSQKVTSGAVAGPRVYVAGELDGTVGGVLDFDGASWADLQWPTTSAYATSVWVSPTGALFGTTVARARIYRFPGSMRVDTVLGDDTVVRLSVHDAGDAYVVTNDLMGAAGGAVYHWNGNDWRLDNGPIVLPTRVTDVAVAPDGTAYLVETTKGLYRRTDDGAWTFITAAGNSVGANRIWAPGTNDVWLFDNDVTVTAAHWTGSSFAPCTTCTFPGTVQDVDGESPTDIYVVGNQQMIEHWDGTGWTQIASPVTLPLPTDPWNAVATCGGHVYIGAAGGMIQHYDGTGWTDLSLPIPVDLRSLWCTSPTDVFAGATSGYLYHYDGEHWAPVKSGTSLNVEAGATSGDTTFWTDQAGSVHRLIRTTSW